MSVALFVSVFLIAACGLIYELIAGTLASYLLGDSVLQFSTIIGSYLFAMGIGSYLSRFLRRGIGGAVCLHRADGRAGRRLFFVVAVSCVRLYRRVSAGALRHRAAGRHAGGPRNPAAYADSERALPVSRTGIAGADIRLSGSVGRFAAVSDLAGAEAGPGAIGAAVWNLQRRSRAVVDVICSASNSAALNGCGQPACLCSRRWAAGWSSPIGSRRPRTTASTPTK